MASYYSQSVSTSRQGSKDTLEAMKSVAEQNLRTREFEIDEFKKFGQLGKSAADKYQNAMKAGSVLSGLITTGVTMTAPWAIGLALAGTYAAGKIGESRAKKELGKSKYFGKTKSDMIRTYEKSTKSTAVTSATLAGFGSYAAKQAGGGPIEGKMTGIDWDKIKEAGASKGDKNLELLTKKLDKGLAQDRARMDKFFQQQGKSNPFDYNKIKAGGAIPQRPKGAPAFLSKSTETARQNVIDYMKKNPPKTNYAGMGKQFGKEIISNWADVYKGTAKLGASKADAFFNQRGQGQYLNPVTASNVQPPNVASPYVSNRSWDPDLMTWN
tara:strand:+ start:835 stop:1812 length:978 start_codon:yes stop_codon:yes gene_type:complete